VADLTLLGCGRRKEAAAEAGSRFVNVSDPRKTYKFQLAQFSSAEKYTQIAI
jgi:hypothetical protein